MPEPLDCRYYFNSRFHPAPPPELTGEWIDLAHDPSAAHQLIKLGISPRTDLPALTLEQRGKLRVLGLRLAPDEALALARGGGVPRADLRLYSAAWCADCRTAKRVLEESGLTYDEINLDEDATAEAMVLARSGGRRVIPTLLFGDRLWLFNPGAQLLRRWLESAAA